MLAISNDHEDVASYLIERGADINKQNEVIYKRFAFSFVFV